MGKLQRTDNVAKTAEAWWALVVPEGSFGRALFQLVWPVIGGGVGVVVAATTNWITGYGVAGWIGSITLFALAAIWIVAGVESFKLRRWQRLGGIAPNPVEKYREDLVSDPGRPAPAFPAPCLYAGWPTLSSHELEDGNRLELALFCFNGNPYPIKIAQVSGSTCYSNLAEGIPEAVSEKLATPVLLFERGGTVAQPCSEFLLVFHQYLTKAQAIDVAAHLNSGQVTLDLRQLEIWVEAVDDPGIRSLLPIARSPNLRIAKGGEQVRNTTVYAQVSVTIGAESAITPG